VADEPRRLATADRPPALAEGPSDETGWNPIFKLRDARRGDPVRQVVEGFRGSVPFRAFGEERGLEDVRAIVADAGGALLGVALLDEGEGRVTLLAVPPISRGFGAGRALVDHAERRARRAGRARLAFSVGSDDHGTYAALRARGYEDAAVRPDAWPGFVGLEERVLRDEWIVRRALGRL